MTLQLGPAWSVVTTTNETETNAKLLDNARASREAVKAKEPAAATQQIHGIGTGESLLLIRSLQEISQIKKCNLKKITFTKVLLIRSSQKNALEQMLTSVMVRPQNINF